MDARQFFAHPAEPMAASSTGEPLPTLNTVAVQKLTHT